jgi:hypothetical protein
MIIRPAQGQGFKIGGGPAVTLPISDIQIQNKIYISIKILSLGFLPLYPDYALKRIANFSPKNLNMKKLLLSATVCLVFLACENKKAEPAPDANAGAAVTAPEKKPATEILDLSNSEPIRKMLTAFSQKNLDAMTDVYADNVRYTWSGGDSAIGKAAVRKYYEGRFKIIDTITFSNDISLPIQVNQSQNAAVVPAGKWVLYWAMTHVKYKNKKELTFWLHNVNHFNDAGKIDFVGQYLDRYPIMEATKGLK